MNAQRVNKFDENKKRTGVWKKYHPNKRIRYIGTFKDGKEIGTFKFYDIRTSNYPSAIKKFQKNSDTVAVSFYYLYKPNLKTKGKMVGKKRVGKWVYYYSNGNILSEEFYRDGKLHGDLKTYYKNGKVTEHSQYKNGLLDGVSKKYSDSEVLIEEVIFVGGKENGIAKYYELNGNLKETGMYKNGFRKGKWEFYIDGEFSGNKKKKEKYKKENK